MRHAAAGRITLELKYLESAVRLRIADDGQGFDAGADSAGFGLQGMREQAERLRGQLELRSALGQGTEIAVTAPTLAPAPDP